MDPLDTATNQIDDLRAEIDRLRQENEALRAERWEPVASGSYDIEDGDFYLNVSIDGSLTTMRPIGDDYYHVMPIQLDPNEYRLCRLQPAQPAAQSLGFPRGYLYTLLDYAEMPPNPNGVAQAARKVREWLRLQPAQEDNDE